MYTDVLPPPPDVLADLLDHLSAADRQNVTDCADRLLRTLPADRLRDNVVLVAFGGGKDSSFSLAFVRAMQLTVLRDRADTFRMRVVTNRHAGMPHAVMANIDRAYRKLGLHRDPRCELLLVDGDEIGEFDVDRPPSPAVLARNRLDILLTGHRTHADARPTFCNACNLSMANAFGLAAAHRSGVQLIITGDSPQEQRAYTLWVKRLAHRFGSAGAARDGRSFRGFLGMMDDIARTYFTDIHGAAATAQVAERAVTNEVPEALRFFSIYDETRYSSGDHWELLTGHLGFEFDELAFSFTESDCANPALMAHLRGLKAERLFGRDYRDGLAEYVEFALELMRRKEFPEHLVTVMADRYRGPHAALVLRERVNDFAGRAYGLTEENLVCMVHSPFAERGLGLERYLQREQPHALGAFDDLHRVLRGDSGGGGLAGFLERISGLALPQLRMLYESPLHTGATGSVLNAILDGDPHKRVVSTRHAPDGPVVSELISGR